MPKTIRINLTGQLSGHTATTLGGWVEQTDHGPVLVAPYLDQAQLTGLLVQLSDLHLTFHQVAVDPAVDHTHHSADQGAIR
jgi:hypothetical protein